MENKIDRLAKEIRDDIRGDRQVFLDPLTAIAIAGLIVNVIRLLIVLKDRCRKSDEDVVKIAKLPKRRHRFLVKWCIKKVKRRPEYRQLNLNVEETANAIFRQVAEKDPQEVKEISLSV